MALKPATLVVLLGMHALAGGALSQVIRIDPPPGTIGSGFGGGSALADLDDDGVGDFAVPSGGREEGDPRHGRVFIYSGRTRKVIRILASPQVRDGFLFGIVAGLPDVDGDNAGDLVVGEVGQTISTLGYAYVFSGRTGEVLHTVTSGILSAGVNYGSPVVAVPDADGDGIADFAVGAREDGPPSGSGRIYLYSGATGEPLRTLESPQPVPGSAVGATMAGAADMNGDGRGDIITGAIETQVPGEPARGVIYFFSGATGEAFMRLPYHGRLASVPDVDGDQVPDVIVGSSVIAGSIGRVWVVSGATGELLYTLQSPSAPKIRSQFGGSVAGVRDVDGDGRGDLLVGAVTEHAPGFPLLAGPGAAYLISGATGTFLKRFDSTSPVQLGRFGYWVTTVPDSNGDGLPEIMISAQREILAVNGRVYLFLSCAPDWNFSDSVDAQDLFDFLSDFFADRADFNHDGRTNSQDFFDFLAAFFAGCPS